MKTYGAKGFCLKCQKYDSIRGISERNDTIPMLVNNHGAEYRHCFEGEIEVYEYEEIVEKPHATVDPLDLRMSEPPPSMNRSRRRGKG